MFKVAYCENCDCYGKTFFKQQGADHFAELLYGKCPNCKQKKYFCSKCENVTIGKKCPYHRKNKTKFVV
jgi:hypothetical protein